MRRPTREELRRAAALVLIGAGAAGIWFIFAREEAATDPTAAPDDVVSVQDEELSPPPEAPPEANPLVEALSTEQKVDQVLLFGFTGTDRHAEFIEVLRARQLGGVYVGGFNYVDPAQLTALVAALERAGRKSGEIPPLIVSSQEGGDYREFPDLPPDERALDVGDRGDPAQAELWAQQTGQSLLASGFDLNLAPVADVATLDSPIADRSFSDDASVAAAMTAAAVRGCEAAGIACAVRHFPGLGASSQSTDDGPATVSLDPAGLYARDLVAFSAAFAEGVPAVVVSHAFYASYDPVVPASLSAAVTTELLRDELGYAGLAITDDLSAGAITATRTVPDAAVEAINAGADLLLISSPEDQVGVRERLLQAVSSGEIATERLDEAVGRVLALKAQLGLIEV